MSADKVTGQLYFRQAGQPASDGRRLFFFVGIVAVPDDFSFESEHQYTLIGTTDGRMHVLKESAIDRTEVGMGRSADGLLKSPIWKV